MPLDNNVLWGYHGHMTHKNAHADLTAQQVRELFSYNRHTGELRWKVKLSIRAPVGKIAGFKQPSGRIKVGIWGKEYMMHRIIWLWMTGKWPEYEIDHVDENQSNNRWNNLREATPSQNHRNRGPQKNNKTGYKGVCFATRAQKFLARIKHQGVGYNLGLFNTAEEAYAAYCKAAKRLHGKWAKI
jgi:hypothetical protein